MKRTKKDTGEQRRPENGNDAVMTDNLKAFYREAKKAAFPQIQEMRRSLARELFCMTREELEAKVTELVEKNIHLQTLLMMTGPLFNSLSHEWESRQERDLGHYSHEVQTQKQLRERPNAGAKIQTNRYDKLKEFFESVYLPAMRVGKKLYHSNYEHWLKENYGPTAEPYGTTMYSEYINEFKAQFNAPD